MGKKATIGMMNSSQAAIVAKDKKEALEILAPQSIKDEKILNFRGHVIGMVEGAEDQILNEDEVLEKQSRITQAFVESIFKPLMELLNTEEDDSPSNLDVADEDEDDVEADIEDDVEEVEAPKKKKDTTTEEKAENDDAGLEADIEAAIEAGKAKKAKKLLKMLDKDHSSYKQYKKSIKKLGE